MAALIGAAGAVLAAYLTYWLPKRRAPDKELFWLWRTAFDRAAFKGRFHAQRNIEGFRQAIQDTIRAVNTGTIVDRGGTVLKSGEGKGRVQREEWRAKMDEVEGRLTKIRKILEEAPPACGQDEIDRERDAIIKTLNGIWRALGIPKLPLPTAARDPSPFAEE